MSNILRRGRLSADPDEDVNRFTSSMQADRHIFNADILVDKAHTLMLNRQRIINDDDCTSILKGLSKVEEGGISDLDHSYEDVHIALESKLIDYTGEDVGGRMHSARSRNDEVATCIRITLRDGLLDLMEELVTLRRTMTDMASVHTHTIMTGFTHTQHAQPTTFAHHLMAHTTALERDFKRIKGAYKRTNKSPLGAAAFASTGFPIDREFTCKLLGFDSLMENSQDAVSSRDFMIESVSAFSNLMTNLSRMAEELILWSTSEFGFIELSDTYSSTSSIMPQKKNPDTMELLRAKVGTVHGSLVAILNITKALPFSYNRDLQEATPHLWQALDTTMLSVRIMNGAIKTMTVNHDKMEQSANIGFATATELADTFVRSCGIPFRTAHAIVGVLARGSGHPTLGEIDAVANNIIGTGLSTMGLTDAMVEDALDPMKNIEKRNIIGGPAPQEIKRAIEQSYKQIEKHSDKHEKLASKVDEALYKLNEIVNEKLQD